MNKYYFIFLIWLLPAYFVFQGAYQLLTYNGIQSTYAEGDSYIASVIDFDVKQIAAQTNGYVVLNFTTSKGKEIEEQLALSVQMAQVIMDSELIPIRYKADSYNPIVIMATYDLQLTVIKVNIAVMVIGLIVTLLISIWASRFSLNRIRDGEDVLEIERVDE